MDIDCDGADATAGDCSDDPSGYGATSFKDTVRTFGISDLNANIHPYVVVNEPPYFNAQKYGMKPLSVMAVVCNNQIVSNGSILPIMNSLHTTPTSLATFQRFIPLLLTRLVVVRRLGRHQHGANYRRGLHLARKAVLPQRTPIRECWPRCKGRHVHRLLRKRSCARQERCKLEGQECPRV